MKVVNNGLTIEINGALGHFPKEFVVNALEKQIPKKVNDIHVDEYYCPNCGSENGKDYSSNRGDDYCPCCGQALDWSDTE